MLYEFTDIPLFDGQNYVGCGGGQLMQGWAVVGFCDGWFATLPLDSAMSIFSFFNHKKHLFFSF